MSTGAVFVLIANDGKSDRLINATGLLNQIIKDVMCARRAAHKADETPTLSDLERTHWIPVNAHYKPFAAIGYEYNKVRPQSGNPTLGGGVTFSIPQFGDFFNDMVVRTRLSAFSSNVGTTPVQGTIAAFPLNVIAGTTAVTMTAYNIVDISGNILVAGVASSPAAGVTYRNFVRYCEFPGNRLFTGVRFDVNGNPLDQYTSEAATMLEKFTVTPNKREGYNRLVGQENPVEGYRPLTVGTVTDADSAHTPNSVITRAQQGQSNQTVALFGNGTNSYDITDSTIAITPLDSPGITTVAVSREKVQVMVGPQTPQPIQAPLEIWNPLRFWFNSDVRQSIPSVSIPFGQRFITIDLAAQSLMATEVPSIFVETITEIPNTATPPAANTTVTRTSTKAPLFYQLGITDISVEAMEMYINNIFMNPEIHDIYIKRIGFSLIRVYRLQTQVCNQQGGDERLLSQLKWPIEYMWLGLRPKWNTTDITTTGGAVTGGNVNVWRDWHRLTFNVSGKYYRTCLASVPAFITDTDPVANAAPPSLVARTPTSVALLNSAITDTMPTEYYLPVPTVDTMSLTSHGVTLYDNFQDLMYNAYIPATYGGTNLQTPSDPGALMINFSLFPRTYQPSGHLNLSRARETYVAWTTKYVSSSSPATLVVVALAINFLLVTDGSAVLRYST